MGEYTKSLYYKKNGVDNEIKIYESEGEVGTPNLKIYDGGADRYIKITEGDGLGGSPSDLRIMKNSTVYTVQKFAGEIAKSLYMKFIDGKEDAGVVNFSLNIIRSNGGIYTLSNLNIDPDFSGYPAPRVNVDIYPGDRIYVDDNNETYNDFDTLVVLELYSDLEQTGDLLATNTVNFTSTKDGVFTNPPNNDYMEFYYTGNDVPVNSEVNPYRYQFKMEKIQYTIVFASNVTNGLIGVNKIDIDGNVTEIDDFVINNTDNITININTTIKDNERLYLVDKNDNLSGTGSPIFIDFSSWSSITDNDTEIQHSYFYPDSPPGVLFYSSSNNNYYELYCQFTQNNISGSYQTNPYRFQ